MLVMAIEAANQMADPSREVAAFELKDVLFQKALNVPQGSEGIETNFYLRQINDISDITVSWSDFRLFSFENENWQENCRGFIRIKYHTNPTAVGSWRESQEQLDQCQCLDDELSRSCTEAFDPILLYKTLRSSGFGFGQAFQRLENGSFSTKNQARSDVKLYQWPTDEYPQNHIVHPTTLDGILHLSVAALAHGGLKSIPTAVPILLRKMWIAKSGLSHFHLGNTSVKAAAWITAMDNRGTDFDISVLDSSRSHVLARIDGLRSTIVSDLAVSSSQKPQVRQVCYHLEMKPDIDLLDREQLSTYCGEARFRMLEPVQFYQDLTFLLFMFLSRGVAAIDETQAMGLLPHMRRYRDWAQLQLDKYHSGELPYSKPEWQSLLQDNEFIESLCDAVGSTNDLGRVFVTTGRSLASIMRGEVDPLEFLFKTDLLRDLYREVNGARTCFPEFARYLDALGHKNPNLKILEVGAGTGGTTEKILSTLSSTEDSGEDEEPRYSTYHYTDISPYFFEQAQVDFRHYPNLTFKTLDIEASPTSQGYEAGTYDLIIAANVLHATKDINITMQHVRSLLKPGGKLMIYEPTRPDILRTGFIAGLMSGWWLGTESYRIWSPALTCGAWEKVMSNNGFSGLDLQLPDFVNPECQEGSILVTTAISNTSVAELQSDGVIIADLNSALQANLAQQLKAALFPEDLLRCQVLSFDEAASLPEKAPFHFIFLEELEHPLLKNLSSQKYLSLRELLTSPKGILWVSNRGGVSPERPEFAIVDGLSRVLRNENPERPFVTLGLDVQRGTITDKQFQSIRHAFRIIHQPNAASLGYEPEFIEINGCLNIPRVLRANQLSQELFLKSLPQQSSLRTFGDAPPLKLAIKSPGLLDTLYFVEDEEYRRPLAPDEVEIEVRAVGLNFRDCLMALGRVPGTEFGSECAGLVTRVGEKSYGLLLPGDRVVMSAGATFKTFSRGKAQHVFKIKDEMTFIEAASIPSQFGTAWQAVHELARLRQGETILIHAGAGGTGQAAIQVSQYCGAEVFTTVGSEAKKQVLIDEYGIPEDHIFYSRDTSFSNNIMRATGHKGVDVVLNSLAGDSLVASWECIASYGRFIEIGKKDVLSNSNLPMYPFRKNASFICFDGFSWQLERPAQAREGFQIVFDHFARGNLHAVRPLQAYSISNIEQGFRLMQEGKTAGKIVLEITPDARVPVRSLLRFLTDVVQAANCLARQHLRQSPVFILIRTEVTSLLVVSEGLVVQYHDGWLREAPGISYSSRDLA